MKNIKSMDKDIIDEADSDLVKILFDSSKYEYHSNSKILNFSTDFILKREGFSVNYFENSALSITQIYELIFKYF